MKKIKILNLYAGIGGNRKLWNEVDSNIEVTAVEFDENIAAAYQDRFPQDTVIIGDAKDYLLNHYKNFDFIWASPPCQTHSRVRKVRVDCRENRFGSVAAVFPDMSLYQIIIFLKSYFKGYFVVENVIPFYEPLINPDYSIDRHFYWSSFFIWNINIEKKVIIEQTKISDLRDFDLSIYKNIKNKKQVIRNQVDYDVGKHIFNCALQGGLR
ncbi:DNA cytosine methyltransferase [Aliarcobacter cryaerophilus]|uniref:DNA cytosine methyltransferase n=1 Tax=Aliarcobacter cryaerophilus TaxID=28198 RepID=UPI003DA5A761